MEIGKQKNKTQPLLINVHAHDLIKCRVLKAEHVSKVGGPVKFLLGGDDLSTVICVAVDERSNARQLCNAVHGVFESKLPVILLVHTIAISFGEFGVLLQGHDADRECRHGMHAFGKRENEVFDPCGNVGACSPLGAQTLDLSSRGDLTGKKKPKHAFRKRLAANFGSGQKLLALGDGIAPEADALLRVKKRGLSHHGENAAHATVCLIYGAGSNNDVLVLLKASFLFGLKLGDYGSKALLQSSLGGKASGTDDAC